VIGDCTPVVFPGVGDEIPVVAGFELLYKLPKQEGQELPRLLSRSTGMILLIKGFIVGMQAQTIPRLTSTALHMNDTEAWYEKSTSFPSRGDVWGLEGPEDC
jgi:hypothetical protein